MTDSYIFQTYLPLVADLANLIVWLSIPGKMLTFKRGRKWLFAVTLAINMVFAVVCRSFPALLTSPFKTIVMLLIFLTYIFLAYEESKAQKWVVYALWVVTIMLADMLAVIIMSVLQISLTEPVGGLPVHFVSGLITTVFSYILMFVTSMIYSKVKYKKVTNKMWQFQVVIISQFLFMLMVGYSSFKNDNTVESMVLRTPGFAILLIATIAIAVIGDICLYRILLTNSQNYELKRELEIMQIKEELELEYYEKLKKNVAETRKLNHDFSNAVTVIETTLKSPDVKESQKLASDMLEGIKETLQKTKIRYYCENELVNLIVINKSEEIRKVGADFSANLNMPQSISIKSFDLCRIFTNLLDNAKDACFASANKEKCFVILSSIIADKYIHIKCENYYDTPVDKKGDTFVSSKEGHKGLGLEVLREIAKVYGGDTYVSFSDNIFTVDISLKLS